jgi:hypothetical protein
MHKYFFVLFLLISCSNQNKLTYTRFEPYVEKNGAQSFKFFSKSNRLNPAYDLDSENERLEWLNMWLTDNKLCKDGFVISERKEVDIGYGPAVKDIYYIGACI